MRIPFGPPALALVLGLSLVACSPAASTTGPSPRTASTNGGPGPTTQAQIVSSDDDPGGTAKEVFERARMEMAAENFAHARLLFDRVVKAAAAEGSAGSELARDAAYDAALCSERVGEAKDARDRFRALGDAAKDTKDGLDANFRRARLDVEIEDWADLGTGSSAILARGDVAKFDRAEALALQALSVIHGSGDLAAANKIVNAARKAIDTKSDNEVVPPQNAAAVHFAHGELLRAEGNAIVFVDQTNPQAPIVAADFPVKMETRCQKILDAQEAYIEAINTKEVSWAVRAGLRVASMYIDLHEAVLAIPPPKSATTDDKKALFRGAMRLRYRILLEKGLGTLDHTINLEKAVAAKGAWLDQAKKTKSDVEKLLDTEKAEIAKLPYTEAQLQKALDDVSKKS